MAECDGTMDNMLQLMQGVNMALQFAKCDGRLPNMTLLMLGVKMPVKFPKFDSTVAI